MTDNVVTPAQAIAAAWEEWLATDAHLYSCIGYSEAQSCCAQAPEGHGLYPGRQDVLIQLACDALAAAGYLRKP